MERILHVLTIGTRPAPVYTALTTADGLAAWWTTRVEGSGTPGGELRFTCSGEFNPVMQVTGAESDARVAWRCASGHDPWQDSTFCFTLEDAGEATRLTFVQEFAREPPDAAYGVYNFNWGYYLDSLKQYCETGRGKPFRPE